MRKRSGQRVLKKERGGLSNYDSTFVIRDGVKDFCSKYDKFVSASVQVYIGDSDVLVDSTSYRI